MVEITDAPHVVRFDPSKPWRVGDEFLDEEGLKRTVRGASEIGGRGRYLELMARRVG